MTAAGIIILDRSTVSRARAPLARRSFYLFLRIDKRCPGTYAGGFLNPVMAVKRTFRARSSFRRLGPPFARQSSQGGAVVIAPSDAELTSARYFASRPAVTFDLGRTQAARRAASAVSSISMSTRRSLASMQMRSPSSINAIGPPTAASGVTCPTTKPWLPPENRPSVIRATSEPSPLAHDCRCRAEHLAHPRTAFRAFVAHHDHIPGDDLVT